MADLTAEQLVARTLKQAGVGHVFTLCGGHILPIYDGCLTEGIGIIDTRHEQAAAHAADAYARLTRGVGVAVVVPGPGVTDAVTGVANAYAARSPVLDRRRGAAGSARSRRVQETEQVALLRPITKAHGRCRRRGRFLRSWRPRSARRSGGPAGLRRDPGRFADDDHRGSPGADSNGLRAPDARRGRDGDARRLEALLASRSDRS
jgi:hypothetical protein